MGVAEAVRVAIAVDVAIKLRVTTVAIVEGYRKVFGGVVVTCSFYPCSAQLCAESGYLNDDVPFLWWNSRQFGNGVGRREDIESKVDSKIRIS